MPGRMSWESWTQLYSGPTDWGFGVLRCLSGGLLPDTLQCCSQFLLPSPAKLSGSRLSLNPKRTLGFRVYSQLLSQWQ